MADVTKNPDGRTVPTVPPANPETPPPAGGAASTVTFSPSGLIVVTATTVQAALAQVDAWMAAHASGNEIASTDILGPNNPTANSTYMTQGQVVVPAGTGPHEVELVGGMFVQIATGTQPLGTSVRADIAIFDETATLLGYNAHTVMQETTATSKSFQTCLPIKVSLPATAVTKTYILQVRGSGVAVNGATLSVLIGGGFPTRKLVARYR